MRPLSPEEAERVQRGVLRPLRWAPALLIVGAAVFFSAILRSPVRDDAKTFLIPAVFFGISFWVVFRQKRQIEADLTEGFAETLSGEVERLWRSKNANYIRVGGKNFQVEQEAFRHLIRGQPVSVDFLPRSRIAVKVEPGSAL